jgi:hypothetical protein
MSGNTLGRAEALLVEMAPSSMSLLIEATVVDNQLKGQIRVEHSDAHFKVVQAANLAGGQSLVDSLNQQLAEVSDFAVTVDLSGTLESPQMELHSELGEQIAAMLGAAFRETVARSAADKALELQAILDQQLAGLDQMFDANSGEILRMLTSDVTAIAGLEDLLGDGGSKFPTFR